MGFINNNANNNRSEELRKRRTQRTQQRMSVVNNRVMNPVNPRPVVVRGSSFGTPIHRQAGTTHARRQFYVTLDQAAGTELRLPALSLVNPGWRVLSFIILAVAAVTLYSLWNSPMFQVKNITLRGPQRITSEHLNAELKLEGARVIELSQKDIQAQVTQPFPELVNVQLAIELPNFVTITATERQPVVAWQKGDELKWIDSEGMVFPARGDAGKLVSLSSSVDLPAAPVAIADIEAADPQATATAQPKTGADGKIIQPVLTKIDPSLLVAAGELSQKLPPETPLIYDQNNGLGWNDPQGFQVFVGKDLSQFEAKYEMYQQIASVLVEEGKTPTLISVVQLNAPFYRLENNDGG